MESPTATGYVPAFRYRMLCDTRPTTCCQRRPAPARQYRNMRVGRNVFSGNTAVQGKSRSQIALGIGFGSWARTNLLGDLLLLKSMVNKVAGGSASLTTIKTVSFQSGFVRATLDFPNTICRGTISSFRTVWATLVGRTLPYEVPLKFAFMWVVSEWSAKMLDCTQACIKQ